MAGIMNGAGGGGGGGGGSGGSGASSDNLGSGGAWQSISQIAESDNKLRRNVGTLDMQGID